MRIPPLGSESGARVYGVGDTPVDGLPPLVRKSLDDYIAVRSLWDEDAVIAALRERLRGRDLEREELQGGIGMGFEVIRALGFDTGFTHMEWHPKAGARGWTDSRDRRGRHTAA